MATETLRPNAAGDATQLTRSGGAANWEMVDEVEADGAATTVSAHAEWSTVEGYDLYNLPAHSGIGPINHIKVYIRCLVDSGTGKARVKIKTVETVYEGDLETLGGGWVTYNKQWDQNPSNAHTWTWAEIDALQIGVYLYNSNLAGPGDSYCTQVYVEVDYTPPWLGKIMGVTNPAEVMGIPVANIAKVKGV